MFDRHALLAFVFAGFLAVTASAADSISLKDSATTKVMKTPKGSPIPAVEAANKYASSGTFIIDAPGVQASQFTKASLVKITIQEGGSGSADLNLEFTLGDDPKYVDGAASAKFLKPVSVALPPGGRNTLYTCQVKIGKDAITIVYSSALLPIYAQQFINFGSIPGGVKFPEGKSSNSKAISINVMVGSITKSFPSVTYNETSNNKKAPKTDPQLWAGTAAGTIKVP